MTSVLGALVPKKHKAPAGSTDYAPDPSGATMLAVQWHGARDVRVGRVPAPAITEPQVVGWTDARRRRRPRGARRPAPPQLPPQHAHPHLFPACHHQTCSASMDGPALVSASPVFNPSSMTRSTPLQDAIVRIIASGLCGSDLHLYLGQLPGMKKGDVLGHEPLGIGENLTSWQRRGAGRAGARQARACHPRAAARRRHLALEATSSCCHAPLPPLPPSSACSRGGGP